MQERCEVCESIRPGATFGATYRVTQVEFDVRPVRLCVGHARIAENSGVSSFEQLRDLYGKGRRSFVPRRDPYAPATHGATRNPGRRATDSGS